MGGGWGRGRQIFHLLFPISHFWGLGRGQRGELKVSGARGREIHEGEREREGEIRCKGTAGIHHFSRTFHEAHWACRNMYRRLAPPVHEVELAADSAASDGAC